MRALARPAVTIHGTPNGAAHTMRGPFFVRSRHVISAPLQVYCVVRIQVYCAALAQVNHAVA